MPWLHSSTDTHVNLQASKQCYFWLLSLKINNLATSFLHLGSSTSFIFRNVTPDDNKYYVLRVVAKFDDNNGRMRSVLRRRFWMPGENTRVKLWGFFSIFLLHCKYLLSWILVNRKQQGQKCDQIPSLSESRFRTRILFWCCSKL